MPVFDSAWRAACTLLVSFAFATVACAQTEVAPSAATPTPAAQADAPVDTASPDRATLPATPTATPSAQKLEQSTVYIYSFLDIREDAFSPEMLAQIDSQLQAALSAVEVNSKFLKFTDSSVGLNYAQSTAFSLRGGFSSSSLVPVNETIASNRDQERSSGAKYRLLEFPADFEVAGAWRFYKIRWTLFDCDTGKRLWTWVYNGKNLIWWRNGERAESRAKPIVDGLISQLRSQGYL